ncbi:Acetylcholine receptor subunit alpha-like [Camponotus floridanus]|uniref:Acetylcholine receptor subunit alpha-like n=1 Tax=Camponotus floridanus TaxID=104421 RepID=E2AGD5_CAMFO|nr:Acetylcholine receptor subunit alpha-like [Camponotus floridanus]
MDEKIGSNVVDVGVDLSEFYMSVEWDILEVPAVRNEKFYTCCDEPYLDITFNITMRRKTLFYTVNIIIPCMGISFLTVLTFYLPSDSGEKIDARNLRYLIKIFLKENILTNISQFQVTLSISILISLHVFFLLVVEIIPPTSLVVPLLGKYLIFAMILVSIRYADLVNTAFPIDTRKPELMPIGQKKSERRRRRNILKLKNRIETLLLSATIVSHIKNARNISTSEKNSFR